MERITIRGWERCLCEFVETPCEAWLCAWLALVAWPLATSKTPINVWSQNFPKFGHLNCADAKAGPQIFDKPTPRGIQLLGFRRKGIAYSRPLAKCREKILHKPGHDKENFRVTLLLQSMVISLLKYVTPLLSIRVLICSGRLTQQINTILFGPISFPLVDTDRPP